MNLLSRVHEDEVLNVQEKLRKFQGCDSFRRLLPEYQPTREKIHSLTRFLWSHDFVEWSDLVYPINVSQLYEHAAAPFIEIPKLATPKVYIHDFLRHSTQDHLMANVIPLMTIEDIVFVVENFGNRLPEDIFGALLTLFVDLRSISRPLGKSMRVRVGRSYLPPIL